MSDVEVVRDEDGGTKKKKWWVIATVILFILALPVLVPAALAIGGIALGLVAALAGGGIAVALGAGGCVLAGLFSLAALIFCAVVGIGFGLVMVFSTPASGLAVLGTSLLAAGAGILGCLIVWQLGRFLIRAVRSLANWLGGLFFHGSSRYAAAAAQSGREEESSHEA